MPRKIRVHGPTQKRVLEVLREAPEGLTRKQVEVAAKLTMPQARSALKGLLERGDVARSRAVDAAATHAWTWSVFCQKANDDAEPEALSA